MKNMEELSLIANTYGKILSGPLMMGSFNFSSPIFTPRKHIKRSYAAQNRAAKKRRKFNAKRPK